MADLPPSRSDNSVQITACNLCFSPCANDPVACPDEGHIYCRECIISNLLAQKAQLRREQAEFIQSENENKAINEQADRKRQVNELRKFENSQNGLSLNEKRKRNENEDEAVGKAADWELQESKRRKAVDGKSHDDTDDGGEEEQDKLKKGLSSSRSFWVPGEMSAVRKEQPTKPTRTKTICPASVSQTSKGKKNEHVEDEHELSLKTMLPVKFTKETTTSDESLSKESAPEKCICPACNKVLSNITRAVLVKRCGHVLCKACSDKFLVSPEEHPHPLLSRVPNSDKQEDQGCATCYVCSLPILKKFKNGVNRLDSTSGIVDIYCGGTGFAKGK